MKARRIILTVCIWFGLIFGIGLAGCGSVGIEDENAFPDIRGEYSGSYTMEVANCNDPDMDRTYDFTVIVYILNQDGNVFSGYAIGTPAGVPVNENISIAGNITESGRISGATTHIFDATAGEGTFTGQLNANTLTIESSGHDTVGEVCTYVRHITATR